VSPMEAAAGAVTVTTGIETGAVLDRAKEVLTLNKTAIGAVAAARATDTVEAAESEAAATTTVEEAVPARAHPAVTAAMTGTRAPARLPRATAAETVVVAGLRSAAPVVATTRRPSLR